MIRFCDKEVYAFQVDQVTRLFLLQFFLKDHLNDIVIIQDEQEHFLGTLTYQRLLGSDSVEKSLVKDALHLGADFWQEAREYFAHHEKEIVPVMDQSGQMQGFAYNDRENFIYLEDALDALENESMEFHWILDEYPAMQQIFIMDVNEMAYKLYKFFHRIGFPVTVVGEKWEWFDVPVGQDLYAYPDFSKFYIYAEGTQTMRTENLFAYSRYVSVYGNFMFLLDWANIIIKKVRQEIVSGWWKKGIELCSCIIPEFSKIKYKTDVEKDSVVLGISLENYVYFPNEFQWEEKLFEVFDKEDLEYFREHQCSYHQDNKYSKSIGGLATYRMDELEKRKKIYLVGPCIFWGYGVKTEDSILSYFQKLVGDEYTVISLPFPCQRFDYMKRYLKNIPIKNTDIVIILDDSRRMEEITVGGGDRKLSLDEIYNDESRDSWFTIEPLHCNKKAYQKLAEYIFDKYLKQAIHSKQGVTDPSYLQYGDILEDTDKKCVQQYIETIIDNNNHEQKIVGSIVMNCNPFTLGHQYLIEYAAAQVELLYIFVVEEDKSYFDFEERIAMVKAGTAHLSNVKVVPSGRYVLSYQTLSAYFEKEENKTAIVDASADLDIFARYIAKPLHISKRFVGEEPFDPITSQYNQQMKEILKEYDIELIEIPRKVSGEEVISASKVRKYLRQGDFDKIATMVPLTTLQKLKARNSNKVV